MPCGTGKTRVAIAVAARMRCQLVLVAVPTLGLVRQSAAAWRDALGNLVEILFVCSDTSVADAEESSAHGLVAPVTTDTGHLADLIERSSRGKTTMAVAFTTYASLPRAMDAARANGRAYDLVVADEAHHCAGDRSSSWGLLARHGRDDRVPVRRRLFLTATPRTSSNDGVADRRVVGMDDADAFGPVSFRLSLGDAIRAKLLSDYHVAVVGVSDTEWQSLAPGPGGAVDRRAPVVVAQQQRHRGAVIPSATLAASFALGRAMSHYPLRRVVSFHSRVRDARAYAAAAPHLLRRVRQPGLPHQITATATHAGLAPSARAAILRQLESAGPDHAVIASNVRCLAEGIDIPALDAVLFADPRRGLVDVVQAVGRVLRPHPGKAAGTVILPVLSSSGTRTCGTDDRFVEMIHVLRVLREHDDELAAQLDEMRRDVGRGRYRWAGSTSSTDGPLRLLLPHGMPDSFVRAFTLRLVRATSSSWEERLGALTAWSAANGHSRIPTDAVVDGVRLGRWAHEQRTLRARGLLPRSRQAQLDALPGWAWSPWEAAWERAFSLIHRYAATHGHSRVPQTYWCEGFALGAWAKAQKELQQKGRLPDQRAHRLEQLPGWVWRAPRDPSRRVVRPTSNPVNATSGELR